MAFEHGSKAKVYCNGYDLTPCLTSVSVSGELEAVEATTLGSTAKSYVPGLQDATISAEGIHSPAVGEIEYVVQAALGAGNESTWCYYPQGDALGARGYGLAAYFTSYEVESPVDDVVSVTAEAQSSKGLDNIVSLHQLATRTSTGSGGQVDNSAASSNGGVAYLQVTAVSGVSPSATIKIQHSADGITWADLATFAVVTASNNAQRVVVTGTVNRYLRATWTISGTSPSFTFNVAFARK
ncbi:hypothetical protein SAMN02745885_01656 [Carboxydocella sporoproducens DSM 16521]|uniref:Uncharacterized protein n=2 Tax=Carboxydocella TaxID=178898 RepID=A0A1T4QFJ0_9FIRM|nr:MULTISPECIES: hypothetical protein [Carboxydocella]AVX21595.1 hypothetical protein CFE_2452 [Carboxydocella thermautotrophica]SKA02563.1 hypothetical protein SAMN02745885_01656 [Carboxydocella sporoproducens DSM 16521]